MARFAGPNLIVGNPVLLKPAPQCPESAEAIQKMMSDAGLPADAYQTILATNDQISDAIADPRVRGVSLTGSERAGAAVAEIAGRNLKKVVLELGGSDPFILLGSDDLEEAVQFCRGCPPRQHRTVLAMRPRGSSSPKIYTTISSSSFTAKMGEVEPGDPTSDETAIGPLSSASRTDRLQDQLDRAVAQGAELVAVGGRAQRELLPGHRSDRMLPKTTTPTGKSSSVRLRRSTRSPAKTKPSPWPMTRPSVSARMCFRTIPIRPAALPRSSTPAWSSSTVSVSTARSCPLVV